MCHTEEATPELQKSEQPITGLQSPGKKGVFSSIWSAGEPQPKERMC